MLNTQRWSLLGVVLTLMITAAPAASAETTNSATQTTADVVWFAEPGTPVGSSHLIRTHKGVKGTFRTSGLMPREALTLWWVVFNRPDGCTGPCGEDDIFVNGDPAEGLNEAGIAAADIVAGYAGGTIANRAGTAVIAASLRENGAAREVIFGAGPVLKDSRAAEIHMVARSHGPALPGLVAEQIGSYAGGCEVFLLPPSVPAAPGECADIQFAIHLP